MGKAYTLIAILDDAVLAKTEDGIIKQISFSEISENHPIVEDQKSFRLGVIASHYRLLEVEVAA